MNEKSDDLLRAQAEAKLDRVPKVEAPPLTAEQLLHELEVHQIELQMQNDELRKSQVALEVSRDRYMDLYEFAPIGYLTLTRTGHISAINLSGAVQLGVERNKLLQNRFDHFVSQTGRDRWHLMFASIMRGSATKMGIELKLLRGDGSSFHAHLDCLRIEGDVPEMRMALTDISTLDLNKQLSAAQEELREQLILLRESEERLRKSSETARDAIVVIESENGTITEWNVAAEAMFGYTREEALGRTLHELLTPMSFREKARVGLSHFARSGEGAAINRTLELVALRKNGTEFPIELSLSAMQLHGKWFATGIARDISERKRGKEALTEANRVLATTGAVNRLLIYASDEEKLLQLICMTIVEQGNYRMAQVGYARHDDGKSIKIMAHAGNDECYQDTLQLTWAETESGMAPYGRAIRSGAKQVCQNIADDTSYIPWRDAALRQGYASGITLPLLNEDNVAFGVLTVYSDKINAFTPTEVALLEELAEDLAFGVRTRRTKRERDHALEQNQQHLEQLQESLEDTVRAIASIVEVRDPYTAGHSIRVSNLAAAIARKMCLPDEQIHAIHLAGMVHDLGKIGIPAELLSMPRKLNNIEFNFIKTHAQAGYDILKNIKFPWPIAQMVLQHHERLDGSGYPQGIKGDAILLEARILAVADVVEAMSSHRPHRPALGMEAALSEIGQGSRYDPAVVTACIEVLQDLGMKLPE